MERNRLLLLEDDNSLIDGLQYSLEKNGFQLKVARTLEEGRRLLFGENDGESGIWEYDLLLLDVSLPDGTGFSLCEEVRRRGSGIPIIFLTAADEETSIIRGLDGGGDDYITKPFRLGELCSRIRAQLRRSAGAVCEKDELRSGSVRVDLTAGRAYLDSRVLELTAADQLSRAAQVRGEAERAAKEALKNAVSDISHQLKTPLAALSMYMEILQEEPERTETVREFSAKALQSLERMQRLIGLLLKIMRLDAGSVRFEPEDCPVSELVREAVEELTTRVRQEGKHLIVEGDPKERVRCDPAWTAEALSNLVKNALDHTEAGGTVRLSRTRSPGLLLLLLADDGCGIPPEDLPHIFKRFYRSGRDRAAHSLQGVGLGLPLAKAVVEGQGGVLSVNSSPGGGNFSRSSSGGENFSGGRTVFSISFLSEL